MTERIWDDVDEKLASAVELLRERKYDIDIIEALKVMRGRYLRHEAELVSPNLPPEEAEIVWNQRSVGPRTWVCAVYYDSQCTQGSVHLDADGEWVAQVDQGDLRMDLDLTFRTPGEAKLAAEQIMRRWIKGRP